MDKINFQNKKLPALNATNLNQLQENVDKAKYEKTGGLINGECIVADISSKNILDISLLPTVTYSGVTVTNNYDGSFTINGTATNGQEFAMNILITDKPGTYTFSVKKSADVAVDTGVLVRNQSGQAVYNINTSTPTNEVLEGYYINKFYIYVNKGKTYNNLTIYPQLEKGSVATEYCEPVNINNQVINIYKPSVYDSTALTAISTNEQQINIINNQIVQINLSFTTKTTIPANTYVDYITIPLEASTNDNLNVILNCISSTNIVPGFSYIKMSEKN